MGMQFQIFAGGPSMCCVRWSNEAATVHADITADHRDVPANLCTSISEWEEAQPKNLHVECFWLFTSIFWMDYVHGFRNLDQHSFGFPFQSELHFQISRMRLISYYFNDLEFGPLPFAFPFRKTLLPSVWTFLFTCLVCRFLGFSSPRIAKTIHFMSSVFSVVTPTWCHGPNWGNPFEGEWWLTWRWNLHFYNSNSFK